jgi:anti-sigma factor RsiW
MATEPQRLNDSERANLVAYLDGELNEAESRALGTKLTQSVTARREIESLQKTWELLDFLPRPEASDSLTTRTLVQVVDFDARGGRLADLVARLGRVSARAIVVAASALLTLALGYAATRWIWPDPSARLIRDLPIAEHLEEYRQAGSFEFLELLDQSPLFNEDAE